MTAKPGRDAMRPVWMACSPLVWRQHRSWSFADRAEETWPCRERFARRGRIARPTGIKRLLLRARLKLRSELRHGLPVVKKATSVWMRAAADKLPEIVTRAWMAVRVPRFSVTNLAVIAICVVGAYAAGSAANRDAARSSPENPYPKSGHVAKIHVVKPAPVVTLPTITVTGAAPHPEPAGLTAADMAPGGRLWTRAARITGVDPMMLYAIALIETRRSVGLGAVAPDPYVVRINGSVLSGGWGQISDAIARAESTGAKIQDVGIMQVYYPLHKTAEPDPVKLLDPWRNVVVGASILKRCMSTARSHVMGVGCYHSSNPALALPYGRAVLTVYNRLVGTHDAPRTDEVGAPDITSSQGPEGSVISREGASR